MIIIDVLQSALVFVLSAYLSITGSLATFVETHFFSAEPTEEVTANAVGDQSATSSPSDELAFLSRLYASAGSISRILSENEAFQNAAQTIGSTATRSAPTLTDDSTLSIEIERALVNIFCEYTTPRYTRTITGTGFFITETGVILTNAHVAQFLLLESVENAEGTTECVVRTGNPALPTYTADLLFISPSWIFDNAKLIFDEHPRGTGEYDYALLYITGPHGSTTPEYTYTHLPLHTNFLSRGLTGKRVFSAGYPAEKLERDGPRATLVPVVASTIVEELYTFGSNYADIFSVSASNAGEYGVSGGPIYEPTHGTIGLIVTKGTEETGSGLRALTLSYIDRTIMEETGFNLAQNARGDLLFRGQVFKKVLAPHLAALLRKEID